MRIIAGSLKGRRIPFNNRKYGHARVTSDFVKKAVFSLLGEDLCGMRFLDAFACSGQIGLEAFSRGADVVMNEVDRRRFRFISGLLKDWGLNDRIRLCSRPADRLFSQLSSEALRFDAVYLDPPYRNGVGGVSASQAVLERFATNPLLTDVGVVVMQHAAAYPLPDTFSPLFVYKQKRYGNTSLSLYKSSR